TYTFQSAEAAYQAISKGASPGHWQAFADVKTGADAWKLGQQLVKAGLSGAHRDTMKMMITVVAFKFGQNPPLMAALVATGSAYLVENTNRDAHWADGGDGKGANHLGNILMKVRESGGGVGMVPAPASYFKWLAAQAAGPQCEVCKTKPVWVNPKTRVPSKWCTKTCRDGLVAVAAAPAAAAAAPAAAPAAAAVPTAMCVKCLTYPVWIDPATRHPSKWCSMSCMNWRPPTAAAAAAAVANTLPLCTICSKKQVWVDRKDGTPTPYCSIRCRNIGWGKLAPGAAGPVGPAGPTQVLANCTQCSARPVWVNPRTGAPSPYCSISCLTIAKNKLAPASGAMCAVCRRRPVHIDTHGHASPCCTRTCLAIYTNIRQAP
ncbi:MAG: NADAR family protein, partial [Harvfovirus sp.]